MAYKRKYRQGRRSRASRTFCVPRRRSIFPGMGGRFISKSLCTGSLTCLSEKLAEDTFTLQTRTFRLMEMQNELLWVCLQQLPL